MSLKVVLTAAGLLLLLLGGSGCQLYPDQADSVPPPAAPELPPVVTEAMIQENAGGSLFFPNQSATFQLRVYFAEGTKGHKKAMALLLNALQQNPGKAKLMGAVGPRTAQDRQTAEMVKVHRPYDLIIVGLEEKFILNQPDGKKRTLWFKGFEGKDYRIEDLRAAILQEWDRCYPGEKMVLP